MAYSRKTYTVGHRKVQAVNTMGTDWEVSLINASIPLGTIIKVHSNYWFDTFTPYKTLKEAVTALVNNKLGAKS